MNNYSIATELLTNPLAKLTGTQKRKCHRARWTFFEYEVQPRKDKFPFKHTPIDRLHRIVARADKRIRGAWRRIDAIKVPWIAESLAESILPQILSRREAALRELYDRELSVRSNQPVAPIDPRLRRRRALLLSLGF